MTIVVGLAENELGQRALEHAVTEAKMRSLPLVLVAVVPRPRSNEATRNFAGQLAEAEARLNQAVAELGDNVGCVPFLARTPMAPADAILQAAEENDAEIIVVGVRRRSPVGKALLGSTSQSILLDADCVVHCVKLPDEE